jgi:hypothetical protein
VNVDAYIIGSSRPDSPKEPGSKCGHISTPFPPSFATRESLALLTSEKVVAVLFACYVFMLERVFLWVGHSQERCGVCAHETTDPGFGTGSASGSSDAGRDPNDPKFRTKDGMPQGLRSEDEQARMWMGRVEEMDGYQCE